MLLCCLVTTPSTVAATRIFVIIPYTYVRGGEGKGRGVTSECMSWEDSISRGFFLLGNFFPPFLLESLIGFKSHQANESQLFVKTFPEMCLGSQDAILSEGDKEEFLGIYFVF